MIDTGECVSPPSCKKLLGPCRHRCDQPAGHRRKCQPCPDGRTFLTECKCGKVTLKASCATPLGALPSCTNKCTKLLSCQRHTCDQLCCVGSEHVCQRTCGVLLPCGYHKCDNQCHIGACKPCSPVAGGGEGALPRCVAACSASRTCGHSDPHAAHPTGSNCPPCTVTVTAPCSTHGVASDVPCHAATSAVLPTVGLSTNPPAGMPGVCCNGVCGTRLACGHSCARICHNGPCEHSAERADTGSTGEDSLPVGRRACREPCVEVLRCGHPCGATCHYPSPCNRRCDVSVNVSCVCGGSQQVVPCWKTVKLAARSGDAVPRVPCLAECKWKGKLVVVSDSDVAEWKLESQLREAASIRASGGPKGGLRGRGIGSGKGVIGMGGGRGHAEGSFGEALLSRGPRTGEDVCGSGGVGNGGDVSDGVDEHPPGALLAAAGAAFGAGGDDDMREVFSWRCGGSVGYAGAALGNAQAFGAIIHLEASGGAALPPRHLVDVVGAFGSVSAAEARISSLSVLKGYWPNQQFEYLWLDGTDLLSYPETTSIQPGERVLLAGPPKCGKTSLIRAIYGGVALQPLTGADSWTVKCSLPGAAGGAAGRKRGAVKGKGKGGHGDLLGGTRASFAEMWRHLHAVSLVTLEPVTDPQVQEMTVEDFVCGLVGCTLTHFSPCSPPEHPPTCADVAGGDHAHPLEVDVSAGEITLKSKVRRLLDVVPGLGGRVVPSHSDALCSLGGAVASSFVDSKDTPLRLRSVGSLSSSELVLVKLVRALVAGSKVVLLDVALSVLDAPTSAILCTVLRKDSGIFPPHVTIVLSTAADALMYESFITSVLYVDSGRLRSFRGPPSAFYDWWEQHLRQQKNAHQAALRREGELRKQIAAARKAARTAVSHRGQRSAAGMLRSRRNVLFRLQWMMSRFARGGAPGGVASIKLPGPDQLQQPPGTPAVGTCDTPRGTVVLDFERIEVFRAGVMGGGHGDSDTRGSLGGEAVDARRALEGSKLRVSVGDRILVCGCGGGGKTTFLQAIASQLLRSSPMGSSVTVAKQEPLHAVLAVLKVAEGVVRRVAGECQRGGEGERQSTLSRDASREREEPTDSVRVCRDVSSQSEGGGMGAHGIIGAALSGVPGAMAWGSFLLGGAAAVEVLHRSTSDLAIASIGGGMISSVPIFNSSYDRTAGSAVAVSYCSPHSLIPFRGVSLAAIVVAVNEQLFGGHETVVFQYLGAFGLARSLATRPVETLTNTETVLAIVAVALAARPSVLLVDDLFVGVDVETQTSVVRLLHTSFQGTVVYAVGVVERAAGFEASQVLWCEEGIIDSVELDG